MFTWKAPTQVPLQVSVESAYFFSQISESHEQLFFLHATWKQRMKESTVVGGTSWCVNLQCLVTLIACIT
jgi:hypothetical protein